MNTKKYSPFPAQTPGHRAGVTPGDMSYLSSTVADFLQSCKGYTQLERHSIGTKKLCSSAWGKIHFVWNSVKNPTPLGRRRNVITMISVESNLKGARSCTSSKTLRWQSHYKWNRENQGRRYPRRTTGIIFNSRHKLNQLRNNQSRRVDRKESVPQVMHRYTEKGKSLTGTRILSTTLIFG